MSEELLKRDIAIDSSLVHYDDGLLLGVLSNLSYELTLMHFSQFHQGYEVVGILQSLRQK